MVEGCADLIVPAAARWSHLLGGGGAPINKNRRRRRSLNVGGGAKGHRGLQNLNFFSKPLPPISFLSEFFSLKNY